MDKNTLPRRNFFGGGWAHPYGSGPFSPFLYADGGDCGGSGSSSGGGTGGDGGSGAGGGQANGQGAGQQSGQSGGQNGGNQGAEQGGSGDNSQDIKALPAWAQKALTDARAEAGKARTTAKENAAKEAREQLLKDLGLLKPDETPDPAKLAAELGEKDARLAELATSAKTQAIELAAYKAAGKHDANPAALLDSRSFLKSVEGLDPTDKDFDTLLDAEIKKAVEGNQQLRAGQAPRRGGGDFPGGPGTTGRPTSLGQAVAAQLAGG